MVARDGDGWIDCDCGNRHWGKNGAAGLLIIREGSVLMQHRAPWVHNGDTWGIPGGARDSHESVTEGALREAIEETGIDPNCVTPLSIFEDDHGNWRYDTVIALGNAELVAHEVNDESHEVRWIEIDKVDEQLLHPSFGATWSDVKKLIFTLLG